MTLRKWFKKAYGIDGLTWPKLAVIALFLILIQILSGFFQNVGAKLSERFFHNVPEYALNLNKKLISFLFYPINTNLATVLIALIIVFPIYHLIVKRWFIKAKYRIDPSKVDRNDTAALFEMSGDIIFYEDFTTPKNNWSKPYRRVHSNYRDTARRADGYFVFEAPPDAWPREHVNGICIDLREGIDEDHAYGVIARAKAPIANTTMQFQLCIHDTDQKEETN